MERKQSELTVITKAKDLCSYVMTVTQKSPKQFRFTFVSRLQNLALSTIENLFRANDVFVSKTDIHSQKERLSYQRSAMTDLKLLGYIALKEKLVENPDDHITRSWMVDYLVQVYTFPNNYPVSSRRYVRQEIAKKHNGFDGFPRHF